MVKVTVPRGDVYEFAEANYYLVENGALKCLRTGRRDAGIDDTVAAFAPDQWAVVTQVEPKISTSKTGPEAEFTLNIPKPRPES